MKTHHCIAASLIATHALVAGAQVHADHDPAHAEHPVVIEAHGPQSEGEIRKIDTEQGKLTVRHGPLRNLGMGPMTMVFKAAGPKLLEGLKEGDKVRFTAERLKGVYTVTVIEVVR